MVAQAGEGQEKHPGLSRRTRQKTLILSSLESLGKDSHVTADEILDNLKKNGTPVAKSTVYRFLAQLEESGELRKYFLSEGSSACYQFIGEDSPCAEHYHLICKKCGDVVHFESKDLSQIFEGIRERKGFRIDGARSVFHGLCRDCASQEEDK